MPIILQSVAVCTDYGHKVVYIRTFRISHLIKSRLQVHNNAQTRPMFSDATYRNSRTWLVQTLLNATKANVCASIVPARSFFANARGMKIALRPSWGMKASVSKRIEPDAGGIAEVRCRRVLYGEKL